MIYGFMRRAKIDTDENFNEQQDVVKHLMSERFYEQYGRSDIPQDSIVVEEFALQATKWHKLDALIEKIDRGDELIIYAPDHLAGTVRTFFDRCNMIANKGAYVTVARPPVFVNNFEQPVIKPTSFKSGSHEMFVTEMLASIETQAQNERTNLKTEGKRGGRPPSLDQDKIAEMKRMVEDGSTQLEISQHFGISQASVSRYYNEIILGRGRPLTFAYRQNPTEIRAKRRIYERNRRAKEREAREAAAKSDS